MSDTITIPPLLTSDEQLTDAGQQLVKYVTSEIRRQRSEDRFDSYHGDEFRNWYAAVVKSPPLLTAEQFIRKYYNAIAASNGHPDYSQTDVSRLWSSYLSSLDELARARAQIVPPTSQPEPTKESYNMDTQTINLFESDLLTLEKDLQELADIVNAPQEAMSWREVKSPDDIPRWMESQRQAQEAQEVEPVTLQEAIKSPANFNRFLREQNTLADQKFLERVAPDGKLNMRAIKGADEFARVLRLLS